MRQAIRDAIRSEVGITASAGIAPNKFLAKIASDHRKPDGLFVITPRMGPAFVETLEVGRFHGVGPAPVTVDPFRIANGALEITAERASPAISCPRSTSSAIRRSLAS